MTVDVRCYRNRFVVDYCVTVVTLVACGSPPASGSTGTAAAQPKDPRLATEELWKAVVSGVPLDVSKALTEGANPNAANIDGVSVLMMAAAAGNVELVAPLLARGANANLATIKHQLTPLMFAATSCTQSVLEALLAAGAQVSAVDSDKRSAADWAFRGCKDTKVAAERIKLLTGKGASLQKRGGIVDLVLVEGQPPPLQSLLEAASKGPPK